MTTVHTFRSPEGQARYDEYRKHLSPDAPCPFCEREETIAAFTYWKIIKAEYPYDLIASRHDLVVPLRHIIEEELTDDEWKELIELKKTFIKDTYNYILEPTIRGKSVPGHFHLHLMNGK